MYSFNYLLICQISKWVCQEIVLLHCCHLNLIDREILYVLGVWVGSSDFRQFQSDFQILFVMMYEISLIWTDENIRFRKFNSKCVCILSISRNKRKLQILLMKGDWNLTFICHLKSSKSTEKFSHRFKLTARVRWSKQRCQKYVCHDLQVLLYILLKLLGYKKIK